MRRLLRSVLLVALFLGSSTTLASAQAGALSPGQIAGIDQIFAAMDSKDAPGCAVGVIRHGTLVFGRGYGMADLEHAVPLSTKSVLRMGSVSKQFTAATVALLALDGTLDLDADIRTYLPELPDFGTPITARHLLHHTSGYRDYLTLVSLAGMRDEDYYDDPDLYRLLSRQEALNFAPGDDHLYSNSGYFLLSQLVLRVTGRALADVAAERIFAPLGMTATHYHDHWRRVVPDRAIGYAPAGWHRPGDDGPDVRDDAWPGYVAGAWANGRDPFAGGDWVVDVTTLPMIGDGGVFSSVEEMAPWVAALMDPPEALGGRGWLGLMRTRGVLNSGDTLAYAFGLVHGEQRGLRTLGHGGAFVGYRAAVMTWPEESTGVVTLCNRADGRPGALNLEVGAVVLADAMDPEEPAPAQDAGPPTAASAAAAKTISLSDAQRSALVGTYYSPELDAVWSIEERDGTLRLRVAGRDQGALQVLSPQRLAQDGREIAVRLGPQGRAVGLQVDAGRVRNLRFERR